MTSDRATIQSAIAKHGAEIRTRFRTKRLALFGSAARDQLSADSDVDFLVEFEGPATFDGLMDLKAYLQQLLGRPIDLVTPNALRPRLLASIQRDLIDVA